MASRTVTQDDDGAIRKGSQPDLVLRFDRQRARQVAAARSPCHRDLRLQRPRPVRDAARQAQSRQRSRNIDRFWNRYVAAWLEGGKNDPKLALLRLDAGHAEIWLDESSLLAGIKLLLGADPKEEYKDKVAEVGLR